MASPRWKVISITFGSAGQPPYGGRCCPAGLAAFGIHAIVALQARKKTSDRCDVLSLAKYLQTLVRPRLPDRERTVPRRSGPDFICIGMQKAGTRWLYQQLRGHPEFWMPVADASASLACGTGQCQLCASTALNRLGYVTDYSRWGLRSRNRMLLSVPYITERTTSRSNPTTCISQNASRTSRSE